MFSSSSPSSDSICSSDSGYVSQQFEGKGFHDPVLHYINRFLMEEDMDEETRSLQESIAYQDTVRSFFDILNHSSGHGPFSTLAYGEDFRLSEQYSHYLRPTGVIHSEDCDYVHASTEPPNFDLGEIQRREDFPRTVLTDMRTHECVETGFPLQQGESCPGSERFSPTSKINVYQESIVKSDIGYGHVESEPCVASLLRETSGSSMSYVSHDNVRQNLSNASLNQHALNDQQDCLSNVQSQHFNVHNNTRSATPTQLSKRNYPFKMCTEENLKVSSNSSRLKAASLENNSIVYTRQGSKLKNTLSCSYDDDDNDSGSDDREIESVSFVQNDDLEAEKFAKLLNDGLTSVVQELRKSKPKPSPASKSGKPSAVKLATTADLENMLLSCAQAVGDGNQQRANTILRDIRQDASPYGSSLQRLSYYFSEGLAARISGTGASMYKALTNNLPSTARILKAHRMLVHDSPLHKISHFFANKAIFETARDASRLHIIDYGISYGIQWPSLISALAERKGGPPFLRMTIIEFPQLADSPSGIVEWTGQKLYEYARAYGVRFEYHTIVEKWENITPSTVGLRQGEVLVVNSMFRLHHLLDASVLSSDPRTTILKNIVEMKPKLFVHGIINGSYTSPFFMPRFKDALSHYATLFDLLEAVAPSDGQERFLCEREYLGREILNVVACEGEERVERPETYKQWQSRMERVGFVQIPLSQNMVRDIQDVVKAQYNKNYYVHADCGWLLVGWKGKVTKAMKLWKPG